MHSSPSQPAFARSASPFYGKLYAALPAEGVRRTDVPAVNKRALMASFDQWVTDPAVTLAGVEAFMADPGTLGELYRGKYFVCTSAGTTGHPGVFVYDTQAVEVCRALTSARITPSWVGFGGMRRMALRGFRWACIVGTGGHYAGAGWIELERRRSPWRSRAYRVFSVQQPLAELVAALNAFDPAMLTAYPSALALLAQEQAVGRLHLHPTLIEIGGESTTPEASAFAAAAFGCPVYNLYSASEFLTMAFGCTHGWLHVNSDWVILEPVDEQFRGAHVVDGQRRPGRCHDVVVVVEDDDVVGDVVASAHGGERLPHVRELLPRRRERQRVHVVRQPGWTVADHPHVGDPRSVRGDGAQAVPQVSTIISHRATDEPYCGGHDSTVRATLATSLAMPPRR